MSIAQLVYLCTINFKVRNLNLPILYYPKKCAKSCDQDEFKNYFDKKKKKRKKGGS